MFVQVAPANMSSHCVGDLGIDQMRNVSAPQVERVSSLGAGATPESRTRQRRSSCRSGLIKILENLSHRDLVEWKGLKQRSIVDTTRCLGELPNRHRIDLNAFLLGHSLQTLDYVVGHVPQIQGPHVAQC